jgi:SAM-dependent methyltransferase
MFLPVFTALSARVTSEHGRQFRQRLHRLARPAWLGTLRRVTPLSNDFGFDRGTPVDRYYIERFLKEHRSDIRGRVLEVRDSGYADRLGTGVERCDVLDIDASLPGVTIVADLTTADAVPSDSFDCFILTQTLQYILDTHAALAQAHRMLRPGGVLLATVPVVCRLSPRDAATDYWRFTTASCRSLFGSVFGSDRVEIQPLGNVLTEIAFLAGMAQEELSARHLGTDDESFPLIIAIRAVKREL